MAGVTMTLEQIAARLRELSEYPTEIHLDLSDLAAECDAATVDLGEWTAEPYDGELYLGQVDLKRGYEGIDDRIRELGGLTEGARYHVSVVLRRVP